MHPDDRAILMTATQIYEKIKDEGRKEGRKEGREALLLRQLERGFGELPAEIVARIHSASSAQLDRWGEKLVTATTLEEIFDARR